LNESPSKQLSKKKAKKLAAGTIAIEDGKTYDMSLWKAIYITVWRQWWWAVFLNGIGSESTQNSQADL
jgi:ATP-binding cassette subfamily C (CFTR/MRP) protein 1